MFGEFGEGDAAFLGFLLKSAVGIVLGDVCAFHEDAFGAFGEFAGFEVVGEFFFFSAEDFLFGEASDGDFDLGLQRFVMDGLEEVSEDSGGVGAVDEGFVAEGGDDNHGASPLLEEGDCKVDAIAIAEADVEQDEVGLVLLEEGDGFVFVGGVSDDGVSHFLELGAKSHTDEGFVLDDEHPKGADDLPGCGHIVYPMVCRGRGNSMEAMVPPPGRWRRRSEPWSSRPTSSRTNCSPRPRSWFVERG